MNTSTQTTVAGPNHWTDTWKAWWRRQSKARIIGFTVCWLAYCGGVGLLTDYAPPRTAALCIGLESVVATFVALLLLFKK